MGQPAPGCLVFTHAAGLIPAAIRWGERLRFRSGATWSHVAVVSDELGPDGSPYLIEALARGVTNRYTLAELGADGTLYEVVAPPRGLRAPRTVAFAGSQVGRRYGFLTIAYIAVWIILPRWVPLPVLRSRSTWICSALAAEALRAGGWLRDWPDIYSVAPAELYAALLGMTVRDVADISRSLTPKRKDITRMTAPVPAPAPAPAPTPSLPKLPNWANRKSVAAFLVAVLAFVGAVVAFVHPGWHQAAALTAVVPSVALLVSTAVVGYLVVVRRRTLASIAAAGGDVSLPTLSDPASIATFLSSIVGAVFAVLVGLHVVGAEPASVKTVITAVAGIGAAASQVVNALTHRALKTAVARAVVAKLAVH